MLNIKNSCKCTQVRVTQKKHGVQEEVELRILKKGDFFGEKALET